MSSSRSIPLSQALTGSWQLLSREDMSASGERHIDASLGADPLGLLFYDNHGNFGAQFMKRIRDGGAVENAQTLAPNNSRAQGGYDAYFGTYTVDDEKGAVTQRLIGALSCENVGQVLTRNMSVEGDELVIRLNTTSASGTPVVRTLRWRRIG